MTCVDCRADVPEDARFCPSCGADQVPRSWGSFETLELRPVFIPQAQLAAMIPLGVFMGIWGGGFFGGFSMFFIETLGLALPKWMPFVFFGLIFSMVLPWLGYRASRKTHEKTVYTFHDGMLDYYEGFFTVQEKTLALDQITEVSLRKGPFQKKHGLGTIVLATPATSGPSSRAGIRLSDIPDADAVYARVKDLVGVSGSRSPRATA